MKSQKPRLTQEELSRIRSEAGRRGAQATRERGHFRGGRPKGSPNKDPLIGVPSRTLTVRDPDYDVFVRCANAADEPIVSFMHDVAESLKAKNPALFAPDAQTVRM